MPDGAITTLVQNGVLGALVVIEGFVIVYLYKQVNTEKDKRLADSQEQTTKVTEAFKNSSEVYEMLANKIRISKKGGK